MYKIIPALHVGVGGLRVEKNEMGLHIYVYDNNGNDLPEWDYIRQGNDRKFPELINWNKIIKGPKDSIVEGAFKPTDIDRIREDLHKLGWDDCKRYDTLLDILEGGKYWVHFSY